MSDTESEDLRYLIEAALAEADRQDNTVVGCLLAQALDAADSVSGATIVAARAAARH